MKRILVFCARDWLHPRSGCVERYVHAVFSRLAAQGHYVVWVSHNHGLFASRQMPRTPLDTVGDLHVARIGGRVFYRMTSNLFLSRLAHSRETVAPFDAIVDCVTGWPLSLAGHTDVPVVPLVFKLSARVRASERPPGPIIATSDSAFHQLARAGVPVGFIIRAPYGVDNDARTWETTTGLILSAIENLACEAHEVKDEVRISSVEKSLTKYDRSDRSDPSDLSDATRL